MAQITLRDYLQETEDAISAGRVDDALSHCQNILAQFPESLEVQRLLGEVYLAQERLEEAQQSFDWVLTNDPENVVTYCDRALISERMADYDTALDCYQQAYELSRGNSQIRQEFNQLSARAGQQGFMFSRAGLARLYMRGDLLTQAIQEWEAVLAVSPERLDARTGLLETYWREGQYDRVEQLAMQILQDVPGCLKAVLLLSYVTSIKNMKQAQELLQRAEELDPDLQLAQELFQDAIASQPGEPFFKLLQKSPTMVQTSPLLNDATSMPTREEVAISPAAYSAAPASIAPDALPSWDGPEWATGTNWNNNAHLDDFAQMRQPSQDPANLPTWVSNMAPMNTAPTDNAWSVLESPQESKPAQEMPKFAPQASDEARDADPWNTYMPSAQSQEASWQSLLDVQNDPVQANEQKPLEQWDSQAYDTYKEQPSMGGMETWENVQTGNPSETSGVWGSTTKEEGLAAPPAWLNMLTQSEKRQLSGAMPPVPPVEQAPPVEVPASTHTVAKKEEPVVQDEESFFFGPEWLKSLGAATMDNTFPIESSPELSTPALKQPEQPAEQKPVQHELQPAAYEPPVQETYETWTPQVAEQPADQNLLRTLEELELNLRAKGFVPLQPNSLSSIAQPQESDVPMTPEVAARAQNTYDPYKEPALSSALAELGNFIQQSSSLVNSSEASGVSDVPAQPITSGEEPTWLSALSRTSGFSSNEEPSWLASLNTIPTSSPFAAQKPEQTAQEESATYTQSPSAQPFWADLAQTHQESQPAQQKNTISQELPRIEPVKEEVEISQAFNTFAPPEVIQPKQTPVTQPSATFARSETPSGQLFNPNPTQPEIKQPRQNPFARNEVIPDSELETTMKRPAVRLQPMQQQPMHSSVQKDPAPPVSSRNRTPERAAAGRSADSNLSYQERLLKGYQHQLVGDYDEAMQEYRIIIRSAPELLADVVSNVRALLKLAPKYSAGYRVLGDAYMRQGEYLQAMEAYNKALTMAKRAKS